MENTKHCLNCGFDAPQQAHFCPRCGSNQFVPPPVRCPICGAVVPQDAYCAHCGADLQDPGAQVWHNCAHCGAPVHVTYTNCNRCGAPAYQPVQPVQPKKKKKSGAWALVVVPILLLLMGAGILAVEYMEGRLPDLFYPNVTQPTDNPGWGPATGPSEDDYWPQESSSQQQDPVNNTQSTRPTQPPVTKPTQPPATKPTQPPATKPTQPHFTQPKPTEPPVTQPKPTDPPVTNTDREIPAEFAENQYLIAMDEGYCETMTGQILVIFLFVNDPTDGWTAEEQADMEAGLLDELRKMLQEAQSYGADIEIRYLVRSVTITKEFSRYADDWQEEAMIQAGLEEGYNDQRTLERDGEADQVPVVFLVDEPGRSYAYSYTSGNGFESVTLLQKDYLALRHEMCHVFGARDMYFPQETTQAAKQYLPNGVMYGDCQGDIDELTAYIMGWTQEISDNALAFLRATNSLTEEYIAEAKAQDSLTGYGTKYYDDGGYYTGFMIDGVRHGEGTYYWNDGSYFTGTWVNGVREGYGKIYLADGSLNYEGYWKNDLRHGQGTAYYTGGDRYTGAFVEGERHGKGTYTWGSGTVYEGDWLHGQRTGKGTMTWTDGTCYVGDHVDGERAGKGTMTWANGSYYTGDWLNSTQHGYGEWYYADYGTRYVGDFVNGKRHGYGTYYYADGTTYYGRWENNARVD